MLAGASRKRRARLLWRRRRRLPDADESATVPVSDVLPSPWPDQGGVGGVPGTEDMLLSLGDGGELHGGGLPDGEGGEFEEDEEDDDDESFVLLAESDGPLNASTCPADTVEPPGAGMPLPGGSCIWNWTWVGIMPVCVLVRMLNAVTSPP